MNITTFDILSARLAFFGFEKARRDRVGNELNKLRFVARYGVPPDAVLPCFKYLKDKYPEIDYKDVPVPLHWWELYDAEHVLSGRSKFGEKHIRERVKYISFKIALFKAAKLRLDGFADDEIYIFGVDGVHVLTQELGLTHPPDGTTSSHIAVGLSMNLQWYVHSVFCVFESALFLRHNLCCCNS